MENKLSAKEARKITDSPVFILARIYKLIKEAAKEGATRMTYDIPFGSSEAVEVIENDLSQQGYQVNSKLIREDDDFYTYFITINW